MAVQRRSWLILGASLVILVAFGLATFKRLEASRPLTCTPPSGVTARDFPGDQPESMKQTLQRLGPIAAPGESFNATDVQNGRPSSRMIFAWSNKARWVMALERGGRAYHIEIYTGHLAADGVSDAISVFQLKQLDNACQTAESLLTAP